MGESALAEGAAPDFPAPDASWKRGVDDPRRFALETVFEPELLSTPSEHAFRRLREQPCARPVHERQFLVRVEREDRDRPSPSYEDRRHLPFGERAEEGLAHRAVRDRWSALGSDHEDRLPFDDRLDPDSGRRAEGAGRWGGDAPPLGFEA